MQVSLVKVGHSQGARVPKSVPEQCHFDKDVNLSVDGDKVILEPRRLEKPLKSSEHRSFLDTFYDQESMPNFIKIPYI